MQRLWQRLSRELAYQPATEVPVRVVIRWFEGPDYLTIHPLGSEEEAEVPADDAWYLLEWPNEPREIERVTAILQDDAVASAAAALAAELEEGSWSWDKQPEPLVAAAGMLRWSTRGLHYPITAPSASVTSRAAAPRRACR